MLRCHPGAPAGLLPPVHRTSLTSLPPCCEEAKHKAFDFASGQSDPVTSGARGTRSLGECRRKGCKIVACLSLSIALACVNLRWSAGNEPLTRFCVDTFQSERSRFRGGHIRVVNCKNSLEIQSLLKKFSPGGRIGNRRSRNANFGSRFTNKHGEAYRSRSIIT